MLGPASVSVGNLWAIPAVRLRGCHLVVGAEQLWAAGARPERLGVDASFNGGNTQSEMLVAADPQPSRAGNRRFIVRGSLVRRA